MWFFRDPVRIAPNENDIVVAPADGRVMYVKEVTNDKIISNKKGEEIKIDEISHDRKMSIRGGWIIGIYMTPFDVHYNYCPLEGIVEEINYIPARANLPMVDLWEYINFSVLRRGIDLFNRKFHFVNERMTITIKGNKLSVYVVLIADKFVNKITRYVEKGTQVSISQKIAFISRGSQVDLIIPTKEVGIETEIGNQVYGGKTIIARY